MNDLRRFNVGDVIWNTDPEASEEITVLKVVCRDRLYLLSWPSTVRPGLFSWSNKHPYHFRLVRKASDSQPSVAGR